MPKYSEKIKGDFLNKDQVHFKVTCGCCRFHERSHAKALVEICKRKKEDFGRSVKLTRLTDAHPQINWLNL